MSEIVVKKIRKFLLGHKASLLNNLSDDKLLWIYENISKGATLSETARRIISDWLPESRNKFKTLISDLAAFKIDLLKPEEIIKIQSDIKGDPEVKVIKQAIETMTSKLDGMGRLGWLIDVQSERVDNLVKKEQKSLPMDITNNAIKQLGILLEKYIEFQMDSGVGLETTTQTTSTVDTRVNALLDHSIRDSADDMAMAASRLIEAAKQKAIHMDIDKSEQLVVSTLPAFETEEIALLPQEEKVSVGQS